MDSDSRICSHCQSPNQATSRYCDQCGSELDVNGAVGNSGGDPKTRVLSGAAGWSAGHATDPGLLRKENEDAWFIRTLDPVPASHIGPMGLFLVADGMGGAAAGEVASRMAVECVSQELSRYIDAAARAPAGPDWQVLFKNAVSFANHEIFAARTSAGNDMGTTLVGALVAGSRATVANVGDSRAYHVTRNAIIRVTKDHSLVQGLADSGQIAPEEMRTHPQRNLILRSLGGKSEVAADTFAVDIAPDEWMLLCTDGLWEMVPDPEIHRIVMNSGSPDLACQSLVRAANENGGHDNITVIIIQPKSAGEPQAKRGEP